MTESQHPVYDALCDTKTVELENLHLDERFIETLELQAKLKSTIVRFDDELIVMRDLLPAAVTDNLYMPGRVIVNDFSAQLVQQPQHDGVWALDIRCTINDAPYFINSSLNGTTLTTEGLDGSDLELHLPSEVGAQFVAAFIKLPVGENTPQELLSYADATLDPNLLAELLFELGQRFGYSVKDYEAEIDQFDELCRALSIKFMVYESADENSTSLSMNGAVDFGTNPTRFSYSQVTSSNPEIAPKESVSIGPSRIPIENYLVMRGFAGLDHFPAHEASRPDPELTTLKARLAPILMTTLETLTDTTEEPL